MPDPSAIPSTPCRRFCFGLRTLFVAATVAVCVGIIACLLFIRSMDFSLKAKTHRIIADLPAPKSNESGFWSRFRDYQNHHRQMQKKYEQAAKRPWLSVEPDLPGPSIGPFDLREPRLR